MAEILHKGKRLQIRKATMADLDFIMKLEYDPENLKFIVPFDRDVHTKIIEEGKASMDVIVEEIETKEPVGYLLINGLTTPAKELEWTSSIGIGGTEVVTPPHELQDYYSQPGDTKGMRRWLLEEVQACQTDAIFLSIDQLLYGGLLTAREKQATPEEVEELLAFLHELHAANPAVPIYAFSILPRLTPQDTIDGYDERRDIMAYSRLVGRQAAGLPVDEEKLAALKAKIPPASLARYLAHFAENAALNERLIDLTHDGTITRLVLGQDDGEEYGIPNIEKYNLLGYIQDLNLTDRQVFLTHGADEIALSLLAAWHNETTGYAPKIFVQYNDPGAHDRVMPYMAVSTGVCTEEKIRLTGGSLAASPEEADFTLLVSTNDTDKDTLWSRGACVRLLEDNLAKGQPTALVDLSKHFNADETVLPQLIAAAFPVNRLLAYAGWNTTSNALGTAIAQACLYRSSLETVSSEDEAIGLAAAQVRFLENRILEDYFYLKEDIDTINGTLKKAGYTNTADLDDARLGVPVVANLMLLHLDAAPRCSAPSTRTPPPSVTRPSPSLRPRYWHHLSVSSTTCRL